MKYVIIVNGGVWNDEALATDFASFVRFFSAQQDTHVVGLVSFDLRLTTAEHNSLLFGGDDLGPDNVLQSVQAEPHKLKNIFLEQIEERAGMLQTGDRFLIFVLAHGAQNGAALLGQNFLTKFELYNALKPIETGATVSIVNTAFSARMDMNRCEGSS
jgi:hypothetical protein